MRLNYIDVNETPVSIMFVADEIKAINDFFNFTKEEVKNFNRSFAMEQIAKTFAEIQSKLEEIQ